VKEAASESSADGLRRQLEGKEVLLVLDNFEHLIAAAPGVSALLASAPQLRAVVTSRERLRLAGEHEYAVDPLPEEDAVALFDVRARAARPGFRIETERAPVMAICRRLDGLPLAVELAAARIKVLTPAALLARLEQRLPQLTGGPRDMPDRQRTLRATIEWSHLLLDAHEQQVFDRLSVFTGGFDPAAATEISGATFDDLVSLHDKSLLRKDDRPADEPRFSMLETIGEYARDRLEARGETGELAERHARYFAALADARADGRGHGVHSPQGRSPNEVAWLDWLDRESGNLHASLVWLIEGSDRNLAVQLVLSLWRLWLVRRPLAEGRRWTERVLAKGGLSDLADYGWLLSVASEFPRFQGDHARARDLTTQAITVLRDRNERDRLAVAVKALASIVASQGDYAQARVLHEESLALGREVNNPFRIASALHGLTVLAFLQGDFGRMLELAEEQLEVSRAQKDETYMGAGLHDLGEALRHLGRIGAAARSYEEALGLSLHLGDGAMVAEMLDGIGDVASVLGEFGPATSLWATAHRLLEESGDSRWDPEGVERGSAQAREALGSAAYQEAWNSGLAMSRSEAAVLAAEVVKRAQAVPAPLG
jgi:predicted ATPase